MDLADVNLIQLCPDFKDWHSGYYAVKSSPSEFTKRLAIAGKSIVALCGYCLDCIGVS